MGHYAHHIWFDHHIHGWILVGGGGCVTMLYIVNYLFALWTHFLCIVLSYWNYNVKIVVGVSHLWCPVHWCPHSYDICGIFTCKKVQTSSFLLHSLPETGQLPSVRWFAECSFSGTRQIRFCRVFFLTLGKELLCRVLFFLHSAKKISKHILKQ